MKPIPYHPYNPLQKWTEAPLLWLFGGIGYCTLEILWRGYTHPTMAICGAVCFYCFYRFCEANPRAPILFRALIGTLIICTVELLAGCLFNIALGLNIWDYSRLQYHFLGQISLYSSVLWFLLCILLCGICRLIRRHVFLQDR